VNDPSSVSCRTRGDFERVFAELWTARRQALEDHIVATRSDRGAPFTLPGWCAVDAAPVDFEVDPRVGQPAAVAPDETPTPNWRETLRCPVCGLNNRQRHIGAAVLDSLRAMAGTGGLRLPRFYMMEQITECYTAFAGRPDIETIGSEYLGEGIEPGTIVDGIRHEDAEHLSFPDGSLDLVLSNDVLEHVAEPDDAIAEIARVLRPGGRLLLSIPFMAGDEDSVRRARLTPAGVEHLLPPAYHVNPVRPDEGSLVFTDFGWDFIETVRASGFADCAAVVSWSLELGHLGPGTFYFLAERVGG
jgi:Methyltransferase domain